MKLLDYLFYRLHKHYNKEFPIFTAAIYLSLLEILFLFFIFLSFNALFFPDILIAARLNIDITNLKISAIAFAFALQLANYLYYKNKVEILNAKYKNNAMNKRFKLWMLYIISVLFLIIPILLFKIMK